MSSGHEIIEECERLAFADDLSFPQVVERLAAIGVERYHADLNRLQKTYYYLSGESDLHSVPLTGTPAIAEEFSAEGVAAAVHAIQGGEIDCPKFLRRIMAAGAASHDVFITGRKATYTGRRGDCYVENSPATP